MRDFPVFPDIPMMMSHEVWGGGGCFSGCGVEEGRGGGGGGGGGGVLAGGK